MRLSVNFPIKLSRQASIVKMINQDFIKKRKMEGDFIWKELLCF